MKGGMGSVFEQNNCLPQIMPFVFGLQIMIYAFRKSFTSFGLNIVKFTFTFLGMCFLIDVYKLVDHFC